MKIRLAKKIMKQQPDNFLSLHKTSLYWLHAWNGYNNPLYSKFDSRIDKAINLTIHEKRRGHGKKVKTNDMNDN